MSGPVLSGLSRSLLEYHLQYNHYPPLPVELAPFAAKAIEMADDGEWGAVVTLPYGEGVKSLVKPNGDEATVAELIGDLHLESFLTEGDA